MMGHMFARVGLATLGGEAVALFHDVGRTGARFRRPRAADQLHPAARFRPLAMINAGFWLTTYLAMGLTFYLLKA